MPAWLAGLLGSLITTLPALLVWQASTRAERRRQQLARQQVDAVAYERAEDIYQGAIQRIREDLDDERRTTGQLRERTTALERTEKRLRRRVGKLERTIAAAGLPVPDGAGEET